MWWFVIIVGIIAGFLLLSVLLELGFRNQGNFDWLMYTEWCNDYFTNNGFREKGYENETSSHPTTLFEREGYQVKVQLNAPLLNPLYTIDIIVNEKRMWHFPRRKRGSVPMIHFSCVMYQVLNTTRLSLMPCLLIARCMRVNSSCLFCLSLVAFER